MSISVSNNKNNDKLDIIILLIHKLIKHLEIPFEDTSSDIDNRREKKLEKKILQSINTLNGRFNIYEPSGGKRKRRKSRKKRKTKRKRKGRKRKSRRRR